MPLPNPTVEELVGTLRLSHKPNLVVEGSYDEIIYGELVDLFGIFNVALVSTGGRETLLRLYDKLSEYELRGDFTHAPVAFIADRDMWVFRRIPSQYDDIIWTEGYSIENDLYTSAGLRKRIRDQKEYDQVLDAICTWFAYKVEEYLEKNPPPPQKIFRSVRDEKPVFVDLHCNQIVPIGETTLASNLESLPLDHERVTSVRAAYQLQLRGKFLFQLLVRFLSKPSRGFQKASINIHALYNDAITASKSNKFFLRLKDEVEEKLKAQKEKIANRD